ncbi:hypothetical protein N8987_04925 [Crocinitomix sp.]|nr:hypothetical protein [Crocinitomix sp.]
MISNFRDDLNKERILGEYLDGIYARIFNKTKFLVSRITERNEQLKGIDLRIEKLDDSSIFYVDEKAQLDYINFNLPTFAFETSYLKYGSYREGWLYDESKLTQYYFLVTQIHATIGTDITQGIRKLKIHSVDRTKLQTLLGQRGLDKAVLEKYDSEIRESNVDGKIKIKELDNVSEGAFHFSRKNKSESPINLVLKLSFLEENNVAKVIYPI